MMKRNQRGVITFVSAIFLTMAVPMIGLAIDGTILYISKTQLQGAVDGAALAAAKALSQTTETSDQLTAAKKTAATYVMLNFPPGYFFSSTVNCNYASDIVIDETVSRQRKVTVNARVTVPTLFMQWLGTGSTQMVATATTIRRDVNIVLAVDRSGSLNLTNSCGAVKQSAINFVNKFVNGRDNIGLITFATSTNVDFPIANNFQTASTNVVTLINNITCNGSTSSAMALWKAYDQLIGLNQSSALNIILFFTDGKPTGVNVNMPLTSTNTCTSPHSGSPQWVNGLYNTYTNANQYFGLLNPISNGTITNLDQNPTPDSNTGAGCAYMSGWQPFDGTSWHNMTATNDFLGVPTKDVFGSNLNNGYQPIVTSNGYISLADTTSAASMAMNAADDAALQIRAGTQMCHNAPSPTTSCTALTTHNGAGLSNVVIYSVGLGNAPYPISTDLLERISNDPRSTNYQSSQATGAFYEAPTTADIDAAFNKVSSQILRLAK